MYLKKLIIIIAVFSLVFTSCQDFLDTKPNGTLTEVTGYSSPMLIQSALANIYVGVRNTIYGANYQSYLTVATDESYFYSNFNAPYGYYSNRPDDGTLIKSMWSDSYKYINAANFLLKDIDLSANGQVDSVIIRKAKGEALFLRSYYYFLLTQWFGDVPLLTTPLQRPEDILIPRTPQKQVYDQIIADMIKAESQLSGQTTSSLGFNDRASQGAVQGILARVFLYAAGEPIKGTNNYTQEECYHQAALWASKLIKSGSYSLVQGVNGTGYQNVFLNGIQDKYNSENIWEMGYSQAGNGTVSPSGTVGIYTGIPHTYIPDFSTGYYDGYCENKVKIHARLYLSFEPGDYRRDWNCSNFTYKYGGTANKNDATNSNDFKQPLDSTKQWSRFPGKWRREYESTTSRFVKAGNCTNFPVLRYSDVLLMYAEALNEIDSTTVNGCSLDKLGAINAVRVRSISSSRIVDYIKWTQGTGYTSDPIITVSGGGGSGAVVSVSSSYLLIAPNSRTVDCLLSSQGSGYTTAPTIAIGNVWTASTYYSTGTQVSAPNGKLYTVTVAGASTTTPPTNTTGVSNPVTTGVIFLYAGTSATATAILSKIPTPILPSSLSNDKAAFRVAVMMERYHELCFEALRQQDLRRWGILIPTIKDLANDISATGSSSDVTNPGFYIMNPDNSKSSYFQSFRKPIRLYTNEIGSGSDAVPLASVNGIGAKDIYWPIPSSEIALDYLLNQNPGY